jgi:hypothetical protein
MGRRSDLPHKTLRWSSIFFTDHSPQGVARSLDLSRHHPLAELFDQRFQFGNV